MTNLPIEDLLRQMSLKEPSSALDQRVETEIEKMAPDMITPISRQRFWTAVTTVAAICLITGVVIGHVAATGSQVAQQSAGDTGQPNDDHGAQNTSPRTKLDDRFAGPHLAMMCSLAESHTNKERCSTCHDGLDATQAAEHDFRCTITCVTCHKGMDSAKDQFQHSHMQTIESRLCSACHTASVQLGCLQNLSLTWSGS